MSNDANPAPTRGVPVDLGDGKARRLRYSMKTRRIMIEAAGGEEKLIEQLTNGTNLTKLLWYGLQQSDPSITTDDIEELVDMENIQTVMQSMLGAMGYRGTVQVLPEGTGTGDPSQAASAHESANAGE